MQLTVEKLTPTKSGKGYMVKGVGMTNAYYSKAIGIEQTIGKTLDAELGYFSSPNGAKVDTIESFTISTAQSAPVASQTPQNDPGGAHSADRFYMAFVSNVVAHAIQSGLIKEPTDIYAWAASAKYSALALDKNGPDPDVPF